MNDGFVEKIITIQNVLYFTPNSVLNALDCRIVGTFTDVEQLSLCLGLDDNRNETSNDSIKKLPSGTRRTQPPFVLTTV